MKIVKKETERNLNRTIIGLDLSLNSNGIAIIDYCQEKIISERLELVENKKLRDEERIDKNVADIMEIMKYYPSEKTDIVFEQYPQGRMGKIYDRVEQVGIIKYHLRKTGYKYINVYPVTLKAFITGKGNSEKNLMMMDIHKHFGKEIRQDDLADAYALARFMHVIKIIDGNFKNLYYNHNMIHRVQEYLKKGIR